MLVYLLCVHIICTSRTWCTRPITCSASHIPLIATLIIFKKVSETTTTRRFETLQKISGNPSLVIVSLVTKVWEIYRKFRRGSSNEGFFNLCSTGKKRWESSRNSYYLLPCDTLHKSRRISESSREEVRGASLPATGLCACRKWWARLKGT